MALIKQKDASTASPVLITTTAAQTAALPAKDQLPYTAGLEKKMIQETDWKKWAWIGGAIAGAVVLYFLYKRFKK